MWLRRTARLAAWGMAVAGIAILIVALRCRTTTRLVWVRTGDHVGYAQLTPSHLDVAYWRSAEYEPSVRRDPLWSHGHLALLTSTEPTPPEPATTDEKIADADRAWRAVGFAMLQGNSFWPPTPSQREAWLPTWFAVVVAFSPLTLMRLTRRSRRGDAKPTR